MTITFQLNCGTAFQMCIYVDFLCVILWSQKWSKKALNYIVDGLIVFLLLG